MGFAPDIGPAALREANYNQASFPSAAPSKLPVSCLRAKGAELDPLRHLEVGATSGRLIRGMVRPRAHHPGGGSQHFPLLLGQNVFGPKRSPKFPPFDPVPGAARPAFREPDEPSDTADKTKIKEGWWGHREGGGDCPCHGGVSGRASKTTATGAPDDAVPGACVAGPGWDHTHQPLAKLGGNAPHPWMIDFVCATTCF